MQCRPFSNQVFGFLIKQIEASLKEQKKTSCLIRSSCKRLIAGNTNFFVCSSFSQVSKQQSALDPPAHVVIKMPALSPTMKKGNILGWKKDVGESVSPGDVLAEIETDKATMEFESQEEGFLAKILVPSGTQDVPVGQSVAILAEEQSDVSAFENYIPNAEVSSTKTSLSKPTSKESQEDYSKPLIYGPAVHRMLEEYHISDPSKIRRSGAKGRILKEDVLNFLQMLNGKQERSVKQGQPLAEKKPSSSAKTVVQDDMEHNRLSFEDINLTNVRKVIAQRLTESKSTIPHEYCQIHCQVDNLIELRKELRSHSEMSLSINDLIIRATAVALRRVPQVNVVWDENLQRFKPSDRIDISMAVSIENGLITPIIKEADKKGLEEISSTTKELVSKARQGKLKPEEFQGGSFSVSNLGMFGVDSFTAVINPPQACILAIGASERTVDVEDDKPVIRFWMKSTLSYDARIVQRNDAAMFLKEFSAIISSPKEMLLLL
eukprot:jgi/Galph1/1927/GphlegSOOS_G597.1